MEKIKETNKKARKIGQIVSQEPVPRPEHNGFQIFCQRACWKGSNGANASNGILKSTHLLPDELFKRKKTYMNSGW